MLSIILNLSIMIAAIAAVYAHGRNNPVLTVIKAPAVGEIDLIYCWRTLAICDYC